MPYPALSLDKARELDSIRRQSLEPLLDENPQWKEGPDFVEETATECLGQCWEILADCVEGGLGPSAFDAECAPVLHDSLNLHIAIAADPDFWRWLTFGRRGDGAEIVDRRYGGGRNRLIGEDKPGRARQVYYGLGPMKKGMFAKLWIRANLMYLADAPNPYDGIEYPDVDLWDSHVIDVDYGSAPAVARAFVRVVRDLDIPRDGKASRLAVGYRDLAKEIRRRHASQALELLSNGEAYEWVTGIWKERDLWHQA